MQWGWYGGFDSDNGDGLDPVAKESYASCLDITVSGGAPLSAGKVCAAKVQCLAYIPAGKTQPFFAPGPNEGLKVF